ncbi:MULTISPECIES: DUF4349 domain-containing protein [unclassified Streptomyces]|uniref:DUF4349 domain-containing protein n=1 Tax=unclassified Streptomyces TaxID=2593676 RepID=UPI0037002728
MRASHSVRRPGPVLTGLLLAAALALTGCGAAGDGGDAKSASDSRAAAGPADAAAGPAEAADDRAGSDSGTEDRAGSDSGTGAGGAGAGGGNGKAAAASAPAPTAERIIRTASLTVRVKDVAKALDGARAAAESAGGYVGDETTTRDEDGGEQTRLVLRVPVARYEAVLTELQGAGRLLERTSKAQDVTDQVVDVESRIRSQRASVARVRELMDRAAKLSDVVELEGELSRRQADLEALLARQASLKDRTALATITLSLHGTPVPEAAEDDTPGFVDALTGGWHAFVTMLRWIAVALGATLPFLAVAALLLLTWLRLVRARPRSRGED